MIVDSGNIEFGYELISGIPYANYLASKGLLTKTISAKGSEPFYFFSPNHEINTNPRSWHNTSKVNLPNIKIHKDYLDKSQFIAPDFKKQYANDLFKFDKETIIICNRHNIEWNIKPINFFSLASLEKMFQLLQDKYQVIYINIEGQKELYDNAPPIELGDFELLKKYPKVINIHDLHKANNYLSFNELQLMLFANCEKFITMNGGHAILASYFGGENIIMSKRGTTQAKEIHHSVNSFYRWYHEISGQRVIHVDNEIELLKRIKSNWIENNPIVNILVRTSNRPKFFENCICSILKQNYKNINIFVSIDNKQNDYTVKYPVYPVFVDRKRDIKPIFNDVNYGTIFPSNLYFNEMYKFVKNGLIMFLDDDDILNSENDIDKIVSEYKKGNELIFWKVRIKEKTHPSVKNFGLAPVVCDISGIGLAFDSKHKDLAIWEAYKRGDYRVALNLYNKIEKKAWINEVLALSQSGANAGMQNDINTNTMENIIKIKILQKRFKGQNIKYNIGDIVEVSEARAVQYIRHNLACIYSVIPEKVEIEKDIEVLEPVLVNEVKETVEEFNKKISTHLKKISKPKK